MKLRTKDPIWIKATDAVKLIDPLWDETKLKDFLKSRKIVPHYTNFDSIMEIYEVVRIKSKYFFKDIDFYDLEVTDHAIERIKEILLEEAEAFYNDQYEYYKSIGQE
jgi:hypothetical protein